MIVLNIDAEEENADWLILRERTDQDKANPYHDPHSGRFTSHSGFSGVTAESLANEETKLSQLVDSDNNKEGSGNSKRRIAQELGRRLEGDADFRVISDDLEAKFAKYDAEERAELAYLGHTPTERTASYLVSQWHLSSCDDDELSIAIQRAAQKEFGLKDNGLKDLYHESIDSSEAMYGKYEPGLRKFVRAQYDNTQEYLQKEGIHDLTLYRGMGFEDDPSDVLPMQDTGYMKNVTSHPLSSWSASKDTALVFSESSYNQVVLATHVPREDVVATAWTGAGCKTEEEYILLGKDKDVAVLPIVGSDGDVTIGFVDINTYEELATALHEASGGTP